MGVGAPPPPPHPDGTSYDPSVLILVATAVSETHPSGLGSVIICAGVPILLSCVIRCQKVPSSPDFFFFFALALSAQGGADSPRPESQILIIIFFFFGKRECHP